MAVTKLDVDPTRLPEIADLLLAIHQCVRHSYRYMDHVMQAAQQVYGSCDASCSTGIWIM